MRRRLKRRWRMAKWVGTVGFCAFGAVMIVNASHGFYHIAKGSKYSWGVTNGEFFFELHNPRGARMLDERAGGIPAKWFFGKTPFGEGRGNVWPEVWFKPSPPRGYESVPRWIPILVVIPLKVPLAVLAILTVFLWSRDLRRFPSGYCQKCGYNLTGNTSGRCPECGTPVTDRSLN